MNDIRSVIEIIGIKNIHGFLFTKKMRYKNFSISIEKELEYPFSKSIEASNGIIQIQQFKNENTEYPVKIIINTVLNNDGIPDFIEELKDAETLMNFIKNNEDFFFKEE